MHGHMDDLIRIYDRAFCRFASFVNRFIDFVLFGSINQTARRDE